MPAESPPALPPVLDPQTWVDLLTVHALKGDIFSARTLMAIHDGVEKLAASYHARSGITVTSYHANLFERLQRSFNNPGLLKEIGVIYLDEFRMPSVALRHFELAREFAPRDRDIEELQKAAALAVARQLSEHTAHSGINEAEHSKPEVHALLRKTTRLANVLETRTHLDETAGELNRQQEARRKTGHVRASTTPLGLDYAPILDQAADLTARLDFPAAHAALQHARQAGAPPEELQACYAQLGLAAFDHTRFDQALDAFLHMRDLGPQAVEGWFNCALVYQKVGRLDDALASYQQALEIAPENPKTWCNLSSVWFDRADYTHAETAARRAIELKPDYARAWDNLASALSALNRLPDAAEACQRAIHLQPALHSAWFKYGVINFQLDNLVMASEAFELTGRNPHFFGYVLYYLSMIAARRGSLEHAAEKLAEARAADPANDLEIPALKELGAAHVKYADYTGAAAYYQQITARQPDDFSAWLTLGTTLHRAEKCAAAREAYLRAADLNPHSAVPWHNLGLLASDQGRHEEARDNFQNEVQRAPDDPKAWYDYAVSLQKLGLADDSAKAFEQAENLVSSLTRRSTDLSAALSIVRRLNLGERVLKIE